ncbi:MerC family mercury resistance protein [Flavobacterium sp.]|uniref:MerC family mercury resistance protein n=1 Tax=Flavobacterium sp. TaxID=239 RepID=UPI00286DDCD4|nr:MerC family mercury resistance protein [Flavobacterium sp.]
MRTKQSQILDLLGISSTTICLVHCFVFPLLTIFQFGFIDNPLTDIAFAVIGMFVVSRVLMSDAYFMVKFILLISALIVILGVVMGIIFKTDSLLIIIGGIGMITGHTINLKLHKH